MNVQLQLLKDVFELLSYVAILVGVPVGLYQYYRTVTREQQDRGYVTYNAFNEKYLEFQKVCLEHPDLDVFDVQDQRPADLSETQQKQELIAFIMLFSIFERAYLMYSDQSTTIKERQWSGWHEYIGEYCRRSNFKKAWNVSGQRFDSAFQGHMAQRFAELQNAPSLSTASS